ncbi:MAG: hypothetical protein KDD03_13165 [Gelidibacter sp.]|nr:hypothetical protein [Gelidibacter sp.]
MNLQQIKTAIEEGKNVYWSSGIYKVTKDKYNQYFIHCTLNNHCIGLTWQDGTTMNGKEEEFYTE